MTNALLKEKASLEYKWGNHSVEPHLNSVRDTGTSFHVIGKNVICQNDLECQIQKSDTGDLWIIRYPGRSQIAKTCTNYREKGE